MKSNFKFLIVLSIFILGCICVGSTFAADVTVENMDDAVNLGIAHDDSSQNVEINNLQTGEGSYTELQNEVNNAAPGSTIKLTKDYKFNNDTESDMYKGIGIDKSLTIDGQGHTIDGVNIAAGFYTYATVVFKNINFKNNYYDGDGGAIYIESNNSNVNNCTFTDCSAVDCGGAIYINSNNTKVNNCTFTDCSAYEGGAIEWYGENGCVSGCSFIDCSATYGGAIYWVGSNNGCVSGCSFINCSATLGGAISWGGSNNGCVSGCSFINCSATLGGAISWDGVNGCVSGCSFINCSATIGGAISWGGYSDNGVVSGCSFINCSASGDGGAISWLYSDNGCVSGCSFINCSASGDGGAISWVYSDNGVVSGCSFINCSASGYGGAISWWFSEGSVNYNVFEGNVSECYGDAISINGSCDCDYNFFGFENTVTTFPTNLIYDVTPNNWVVLNISKANGQYSVNFICNNGSTLTEFMPNYTASLNINDDVKEITIKNNTFKDAPICGDYLLTSINSGNTLARATLNWNTTSYNISTTNCTYGENATVTVKINESATGNITVKVDDGQVIPMLINNGVVFITIFNLSGGVHNLNISYSGDDNYLPFETTEFTVTVSKTTPEVIVSVENVTYGEDAIVNVTVIGVDGKSIPSGNVTIFVNGSEVANRTLNDGKCNYTISDLNAGNYNIRVVYNGDNNYTSVENSAGLTVIPKEIDIVATLENITYGDNLSGSVDVGMDGTVIIQIVPGSSTPIFVGVDESGEFSISKNLSARDYENVRLTFISADGNYVGGDNVDFTIANATGSFKVSVKDSVYGSGFTINVTDAVGVNNEHLNGTVIVTINNKKYRVNISNGNGSLVVSDVLLVGEYPVSASLTVPNYKVITNITKFNVAKFNPGVSITTSNINYGDDLSVNVTVTGIESDVPSGNVTIFVNDTEIENKTLTNGECEFIIPDLAAGDYNIRVVYNGNGNYNSSNSSADVTVSPVPAQSINISVNVPEYGDDAVVNVTVIGVDGKAIPSGNVTIIVNGTEYDTVPLTDGVCTYNITGLVAGNYNVTVVYNGDNNYTSIENSTTLTVIPKPIDVDVVINNATYGNDTISGVVNASMNGTVTVVIDNSTSITVDVNESGEFSIPLKLPAGVHNVSVTFLSADGNYRGDSNVSLNIAKAEPQVLVDIVSVEASEIKFGDTVVSIVDVPDDATGIVYFSLDNKTWTPVNIPDDTNLVEYRIPDLDADNYILFVKYSGDNNYNPVYSENPFTVNQLNTVITVDPVKGKAGEKVKITVRVTDERGNPVEEGTVIIGFNGKEYTANVVDGIATVEVVLPSAGTYSATAYYEGFNYNSSSSTFTVEVSDIPGPNPNPTPNPVNNGVGNMENTGNPLLVLLIALCAIGLESFRRKF